MYNKNIKIGFWGGPEYSVITLDKLQAAGFTIAFVVTSQDKPKGRNLTLTPPPVKTWALAHDIPVFQPERLSDYKFEEKLRGYKCDVFVVMAYGKIIPDQILNIPKGKSLNIHPSLLPKFRGPCPIESAILADERETGVTVMLMDSDMDHGPIIAQQKVIFDPWPPFAENLGRKLVEVGSDLLVSILPDWIAGKIVEKPQDHSLATYTEKIKKEDGLIDLTADPYENYLKFKAYKDWPSAFFFNGSTRVKITEASYVGGEFIINKVVPEGKKEMRYADFLKSSSASIR